MIPKYGGSRGGKKTGKNKEWGEGGGARAVGLWFAGVKESAKTKGGV